MYSNGGIYIPDRKPPLGALLNPYLEINKGLVLNAPLNEGSGNIVKDLSGNGNTGTFTGTPDWGAGFYGPQVRCDDDQYITFASKAIDYFTDKFTIVWIGTPVQLAAGIRYFFAGQYHPTASDFDWGVYLSSSYYPVFYVRNVTNDAVSTINPVALTVGKKVCIVGRYDGANISIWVNGVKKDEDAQTGNVQGSYDFKLGHIYDDDQYADMKTDYLSIYNRALLSSEIALLCREPFCGFRWTSIIELASYVAAAGGISMPLVMQQMNQFDGGMAA